MLISSEFLELRGELHVITTFVDITAHKLDISERRRAEETRRLSEARYRALFDYAPDGIVIADASSNYLDANASICRMLGYTREELVGLNATDIVVPEETEHIGPALRAITTSEGYHREWRFRRKDGSTFTAEVIGAMMPDGNLLGMIRDTTERNRTEGRVSAFGGVERTGRLFQERSAACHRGQRCVSAHHGI